MPDIGQSLIILAVLLFSLTVHEMAHALTADWYGDPTARRLGRISLNPAVHVDPVGTIMLPLLGLLAGGFVFGWAKIHSELPQDFTPEVAGFFDQSPLVADTRLGFGGGYRIDIESPAFADYYIPAATDKHPVRFETFADRVDEVVRQVDGKSSVMPLAHGYVPLEQWKRTVAIVRDTAADGMWVQRYCYLSDEKISALAGIWNVKNAGRMMAMGSFF